MECLTAVGEHHICKYYMLQSAPVFAICNIKNFCALIGCWDYMAFSKLARSKYTKDVLLFVGIVLEITLEM